MKTEFKPAQSKDISLLLNLMKEFYAIEHLNYDESTIRQVLEQLISNQEYGFIRLIFVDDMPAGYVVVTFGFSIEFHGRDALVDEFYMREEFRGKGIGSECLKLIEELCIGSKIKAIHLEVDHTNIRAKELYHRFGYEDHKRYLLTKWIDQK